MLRSASSCCDFGNRSKQGAADRGQYREAAGDVAEKIKSDATPSKGEDQNGKRL
jgi:hypothetical protein